MTLFRLGNDIDRGTAAFIKDRTHRLAREAPMPGAVHRPQGRSYPGCDEPRFHFKAWLRRRLKFNAR